MIDDVGSKVLVTGNTGFKGSWLSQVLLDSGVDVVGLSLKPHTTPSLYDVLGLDSHVKTYIQDIRDSSAVADIIRSERPDSVIHLAAQPIVRESYRNPHGTLETNVNGTINLLEGIRSCDSVRSVVIVTSDKVYLDQHRSTPYFESDVLGGYDPYSASKAAVEVVTNSYIKSFFNPDVIGGHGALVATARAGNVIGGGDWSKDRIVPDIVRASVDDVPVSLRYPDAIRPWQHVLEPLSGYLLLLNRLYAGDSEVVGPWNFGSDDASAIRVEDLVSRGISVLGRGSYVVERDEGLHETHVLRLDSSKAKDSLGWSPTLGISETLDRTFGWYKGFYSGVDPVSLTSSQIKSFFNS